MTHPPDPTLDPTPDAGAASDPTDTGWANLARATEQLRRRPEPRAVEVANDVLRRALQSSRPSLPIRAHAPHDYVRVSDQLLIRALREAVDGVAAGVAVGQVIPLVTPRGRLEEVTVELLVQYGEVVLEVADRVRSAVRDVVAELLGVDTTHVDLVGRIETDYRPAAAPGSPRTHVHVSDVTRGDPHLVDPGDERD